MLLTNTAVENEEYSPSAENENVSEYKIGHTTYIVNLVFNPKSSENISDIVKRLIERDIKKQAA